MTYLKTIETIATIVFGVMGWILFCYKVQLDIPKLKGKILFAWHGVSNFEDGRNPDGTFYFLYPSITNSGAKPIHILDYELEIDYGKGFERIPRVYLLDNSKSWDFGNIYIDNFLEKLIYNKEGKITHGKILHGFIVFGKADVALNQLPTISYKLTCVDVFNKRHVIQEYSNDINHELAFFNLAGARWK